MHSILLLALFQSDGTVHVVPLIRNIVFVTGAAGMVPSVTSPAVTASTMVVSATNPELTTSLALAASSMISPR
jgi:hypothetical protein